jgi:uncharacterized protein (DUF1330 family)
MTAPAYLIVEMHISDPEQYKQYMAAAPAVVKAFGGEYLVRGGRHETLEGDWQPHRVAMLRFPSFVQAKAFYEDSDYVRRPTSTWSSSKASTSPFDLKFPRGPQ